MYWLDYSAAKLSGATIKNAGYGGVIRYIDSPDRLRTKHTNKAEYDDHIRNGLQVRLVMQNTTTDADGGWNAGVANAQRAKAGADYLGYTGVIFFTNDRTTVPNVAAWQAYLDGAASVLGKARVGAYGFANALNAAKGHASAFWQAGRRSDLVGHANFWQDNNTQVTVGGITCDRNLVINDYVPSGGGSSTGHKTGKSGEDVAQIYSFGPCAKGETRLHTFVLPVGSVSQVTNKAWLSFKSAGGGAKYVRLMGIRGGTDQAHRYPVDKVWENLPADSTRVYIEVGPGSKGTADANADGTDQFTAFIACENPYSLCIEIEPK